MAVVKMIKIADGDYARARNERSSAQATRDVIPAASAGIAAPTACCN